MSDAQLGRAVYFTTGAALAITLVLLAVTALAPDRGAIWGVIVPAAAGFLGTAAAGAMTVAESLRRKRAQEPRNPHRNLLTTAYFTGFAVLVGLVWGLSQGGDTALSAIIGALLGVQGVAAILYGIRAD